MLRLLLLLVLSFFATDLFCQVDKVISSTTIRMSEEDIQLQHLYIQANQFKILNKYEEALKLYNKILEKSDVNPSAHHDMARIYAALEEYDKAITSGKKAIRFSPENKWYKLSLVEIYEKAMYYSEASDMLFDLTRTVKQEDLFERCAHNLILNNEIEEAIKVYDEADEVLGWSQSRSDEKVDLFLKLGNERGALEEIRKWVKLYPSNTEYLIKLARYFDFRGQAGEARKTYLKVLGLAPQNEEALTYINRRETGTDRSDLSAYINNKNVGLDNKVLTLIPLIENADPEILDLCASIVTQYPDNAKSYALYGDALWLKGNVDEAIVQYSEAINLNKSVYQVWDQLMIALTFNNNFETLRIVAREAMDFYPNQAGPYFYNAIASFDAGDLDEAMDSNEEALFISELSQGDLYSRAVMQKIQILLSVQEESGALEFLEGVSESGKTPEILEIQGDLYLSTGDKASAVKLWQDALTKGGDKERIQSKIDSL